MSLKHTGQNVGDNTDDTNESPIQDHSRASSSGWPVIEDYMSRHDHRMVKDVADDIDTLLVFAGLFSAVLTAFVVESYHSLLPDETQTSINILERISSQLDRDTPSPNFGPGAQANFQATFQPPSSAVTINTLWFLSLVFSLAAALFGILAKQWLREYLHWNHVLAPSRENVLIRQMRLEAWDDWRILTIVSIIPALLEVGVIMFLIGMIVFLWTLHKTVALVSTASIVIFLATASCATILPAFSRRCPYRSSTSWAFVYLVEAIRRFVHSFSPWFEFETPTNVKEWRQRDLQVIDRQSAEGINSAMNSTVGVARDIFELTTLTKALVWMLCGSEETHLVRDVSRCTRSLHTTRMQLGHAAAQGPGTTAAYYAAAFEVLRAHRLKLRLDVDTDERRLTEAFDTPWRRLGSPQQEGQYTGSMGLYVFSSNLHIRWDGVKTLLYWRPEIELKKAWVLRRLALADLQSHVNLWIEQRVSPRRGAGVSPTQNNISVQEITLQRIFGLLFILCLYGREVILAPPIDRDSIFTEEFTTVLVNLYHELAMHPEAHISGLTAVILEALCTSSKVGYYSQDSTTITVVCDSREDTLEHAVSLAMQLGDRWNDTSSAEDLNLFVLLSDLALRCIISGRLQSGYSDSPLKLHEVRDACTELLSRMSQVAEQSFEQGRTNCGCFAHLPWVGHLRKITEIEHNTDEGSRYLSDVSYQETFKNLLLILWRSLRAGLLTEDTVQDDLSKICKLVGLREDDYMFGPQDSKLSAGLITPPLSP